jgi:NAD(P)H dehydrogenase (quinone)
MTSTTAAGRLVGVTGVTGGLGGRVARRLADAGVAQRLLARDPARVPDLPGSSVAQMGDGYHDAGAMRSALTGVHTLFLVSGGEAADRRDAHATAVDAAVDARIAHIVYVSFLGAGPDATFTFARDHWHTEEHIRARGVPYTMLRDNLYLDVWPHFVGADGVVRGPAGTGRFGGIARDDIADVAATVLAASSRGDTSHEGRTYDLTGPVSITLTEVAADLTTVSGQLITYDAETLDQAYKSRSSYGAPDWMVAGWVTTYAAIATGELDVVTSTVADLAGHEPMSFAEFLATNPSEFDHLRRA